MERTCRETCALASDRSESGLRGCAVEVWFSVEQIPEYVVSAFLTSLSSSADTPFYPGDARIFLRVWLSFSTTVETDECDVSLRISPRKIKK